MKKLLAISALVGAGLVLTTSAVMAYRGDVGVFGPNHTEERHEAMLEVFNNGDYNAWKTLMGDRPVTEKINEGNWAKFQEMHQLRLAGKIDEANQIRTELGLGFRQGRGK